VLPTAFAGLASTLLLAWASYRWLESPFIRLKDRRNIHSGSIGRMSQRSPAEHMRRVA